MRYVVSEIILDTLKEMNPQYPEVTKERLETFAKLKEEILSELPPEDKKDKKNKKDKKSKKEKKG